MCGITGIITEKDLTKKLVTELKKLEYRGYDSAGICTSFDNKFFVTKEVGEVKNLEKKLDYDKPCTYGIGHTRWATHGEASIKNCHPHLSKNWAVVHNGIIENYMDIKKVLKSKGVNFLSDTDSECVSSLLEFYNVQDEQGIAKVIGQLKGSFALAMINKNIKDKIFVAKNSSPLYIAKCGEDMRVSSDIVSFYNLTDEFFALGDNEISSIEKDKITFFDKNGKEIFKSPNKLVISNRLAEKQDYDHFMLKEIFETSGLLKDVYKYYTHNEKLIYDLKKYFRQASQVLLVGCGTAYHSALMGERLIKQKLSKPVFSYIASEFIYDDTYIDTETLAIFISQSGETADTISALKKAKSKGAKVIALTNNVNSQIAFLADIVLPVLAGPEIAVASTKAYNCQCFILGLISSFISGGAGFVKNFDELVYSLKGIDSNLCLDIAQKIKGYKQAFFVGRGVDYVTSCEASLKLKEISYINSSAFPSGELKHGSLALIDKNALVFNIITDKALKEKSLISLGEVKTRKAKVIVISPFDEVKKYLNKDDIFIKLQDLDVETYQLATTYCQLISYYTSTLKGINPDKPRNLAKSVTVE